MTPLTSSQNMTVSSVCLFRDRRFASNIQHIFNFFRADIAKTKCDLSMIGKELCMYI